MLINVHVLDLVDLCIEKSTLIKMVYFLVTAFIINQTVTASRS